MFLFRKPNSKDKDKTHHKRIQLIFGVVAVSGALFSWKDLVGYSESSSLLDDSSPSPNAGF